MSPASPALEFRHANRPVRLEAGAVWTTEGLVDPYRDTPAGDLWDIIAAIRRGTPWRQVVRERYAASQRWLSDIVTDESRDLFFRQHPLTEGSRVLDIGAGWGQIALPLARRGHAVAALEPTPERLAFIHAAAQQEGVDRQMHFLQADFFAFDAPAAFDVITCIGVLEWVPKFRAGNPRDVQLDFLRRVLATLRPGGQLVLGIENRLGLKYLLGANDDHIGVPHVAVYDATLASAKWRQRGHELRSFTFSQIELDQLLQESGFTHRRFFAAFPDYKLPRQILPLGPSVDRFFLDGGYIEEHDGSDGRVLPNQAELGSHYRSFAKMGLSYGFVPSFFVVATLSER